MRRLVLPLFIMLALLTACQFIPPPPPTSGVDGAEEETAVTESIRGEAVEAAGLETANQRANLEAGISSENVSELAVAWQVPTEEMVTHAALVDDGVVYFADWGGMVYAVDVESGEVIWQQQVAEEVMSQWPWYGFAGTGALSDEMLFEASVEGMAYGIDRETGEVVWQTEIAEDEHAGNLSRLLHYNGTIYLGLQSVEEPLDAQMEDFTPDFRGEVMALDAETGDFLWRLPLVEEPHNGVAIWSSFALDPGLNLLYFATGNNYTGEATALSDAMIAVDADTGEIVWSYQVTPNDVWTKGNPVGPDYDFGAGPQIFDAEIDGEMRHLVGAGQKSGFFTVFDRATGEHVWSTFVGFPDIGGGIRGEAGIGADAIYVWSNNGYVDGKPPTDFPITVKALDKATGNTLWFTDTAQPAVGWAGGYLANDIFFVGSLDGTLQGYSTEDGSVLWQDQTPSAVGSPLIVVDDILYVGAGVPQGFGGGDPATNGMFAFRPTGEAAVAEVEPAAEEAETAELTLTTATSEEYGQYIATADGRPVYMFTPDSADESTCYDDCANAWPPVTVESLENVQVGEALDRSLLSTLEREDGAMQLVYNGHPLYYFVRDEGADAPQGQEIESFGGEWYLLTPQGTELEAHEEGEEETQEGMETEKTAEAEGAEAEGETVSMAEAVWQTLQNADYREQWSTVPGKGTLYAGQHPHGALLSTYLNPAAVEGMDAQNDTMPEGATIVKENWMDGERLASITVMLKEPGFDPDHNNWFWAKYAPDGAVEVAGQAAGCIACHGAVQSNDYIFTFPVAPIDAEAVEPDEQTMSMIEALWQMLQEANYQEEWALVPGKGALYQGQPPHGALLTTYLNPAAEEEMNAQSGTMPADAVIVKENYTEEEVLDSLTVMAKEPSFDPEHNNWFWAKYAPDGSVQAAGKAQGCIACHGAVQSNDYIFTFPIAPISPDE